MATCACSGGRNDRSAYVDGRATPVEDRGVEGKKPWAGVFLSLPAGASSEVAFDWVAQGVAGPSGTYQLLIQKQPGTQGLCLALNITSGGSAARSVTVEGGLKDPRGEFASARCLRDGDVLVAFGSIREIEEGG